jgi:hypothetical protein
MTTRHPTSPIVVARAGAAATHAPLALVLLLALGGCSSISWPWQRDNTPLALGPSADRGTGTGSGVSGTDDTAAECAGIRDEIRSNQETLREAPTTSTAPQIVAASEGKADHRIEELQTRLDSLNCPSEDKASSRAGKTPPLQPAPGGVPP